MIPTLDQSGAERQLTLLATELAQRDFDVNVVALNRGGYYAQQLADSGVSVSVLEKRFRFDPLTYVRLRRVLHKWSPDIVQSFLFSANSYVRLPGICPRDTKVIVSERCVDSWKSGWQLKLDRWQRERMSMMTANSESVAAFYRETAGVSQDLIRVIPNGVPQISVTNRQGDIRAEFGLPPETPVVGFAGRLAPQKCLRDLVWAFHLLHQSDDDVVLILVGSGPERDSLAEFATSVGCRERVYFTEHREDACDVIAQCDMFCLPSSFEGMSNSLMEAMSAGVPCVVSDIESNRELINHEEDGFVVPLGDSKEICKALRRLLENKELAQRLGQSAAAKIQNNFSVDQMVQSHIDLYDQL